MPFMGAHSSIRPPGNFRGHRLNKRNRRPLTNLCQPGDLKKSIAALILQAVVNFPEPAPVCISQPVNPLGRTVFKAAILSRRAPQALAASERFSTLIVPRDR